MPELPDVEVYRRRLVAAVRRRRLRGAEVLDRQVLDAVSADGLDAALAGARVVATRRRGKNLYAVTDGGPHLRLHFGMTGDLVLTGEDAEPPRFARVAFPLTGGRRLWFVDQRKLGRVGLVEDVDADIERRHLGPDAYDLGEAALADLLRRSRGALKAVLTDQGRIAGLGNLYTDEILFQARLDPRAPAASLTRPEVRRLHRQVRRVLDRAVEAEVRAENMPRGWLIHRRTEGAACARGNGEIRRFSSGGRHGYWCPACQGGDPGT